MDTLQKSSGFTPHRELRLEPRPELLPELRPELRLIEYLWDAEPEFLRIPGDLLIWLSPPLLFLIWLRSPPPRLSEIRPPDRSPSNLVPRLFPDLELRRLLETPRRLVPGRFPRT